MNCPNCKTPFVEEKAGKNHCVTCGWFEKVGKEWESCEAPELEPESSPEPVPQSRPERDPNPAALEPDPAKLEPNPAELESDPAEIDSGTYTGDGKKVRNVKKILGGLITLTEVDE